MFDTCVDFILGARRNIEFAIGFTLKKLFYRVNGMCACSC